MGRSLYGSTFELLEQESASKGISKPSIALIGTDSQSGKSGVTQSASAAQGSGMNVVHAKATIPAPPAVVGDYRRTSRRCSPRTAARRRT